MLTPVRNGCDLASVSNASVAQWGLVAFPHIANPWRSLVGGFLGVLLSLLRYSFSS